MLSAIYEQDFLPCSFGGRPELSAHKALATLNEIIAGRKVGWVLEADLKNFFGSLDHGWLLRFVELRVGDPRIISPIRRWLKAGIMEDGLTTASTRGTPQGGPLSPLLSNILLDDLDKELERRGSAFCRYADDCNIYVHSKRAGERVKASVTRFLRETLKLKVNEGKSAVGRPWKRRFLGYTVTMDKEARLRASERSIKRLKDKLRDIFRGGSGCNIGRLINERVNPLVRGWKNYFKLSRVKTIVEELDGWIRRRLRLVLWRQMKRAWTRAKRLMERGLDKQRAWKSACNGRGPWWNSGASHMNEAFPVKYFRELGLMELQTESL